MKEEATLLEAVLAVIPGVMTEQPYGLGLPFRERPKTTAYAKRE
jgi:hypothetical protein